MIEVQAGLWVGSAGDYERQVAGANGWWVIQACKEPYHRQALGYTGRSAPKASPEYLWAKRGNRLILNMVDAPDPRYFDPSMIDKALATVADAMRARAMLLIHCNEGRSRAPSLAMLWLAPQLPADVGAARAAFTALYPPFEPGPGIWGYIEQHWPAYRAGGLC